MTGFRAPIGTKDLADAQQGIKPKGKRAIQMPINIITRVNRKKCRPLLLIQIPTHKLRFGYLEILERINRQPFFLKAEAAKRPQDAKGQALTAGIVSQRLHVAKPKMD